MLIKTLKPGYVNPRKGVGKSLADHMYGKDYPSPRMTDYQETNVRKVAGLTAKVRDMLSAESLILLAALANGMEKANR